MDIVPANVAQPLLPQLGIDFGSDKPLALLGPAFPDRASDRAVEEASGDIFDTIISRLLSPCGGFGRPLGGGGVFAPGNLSDGLLGPLTGRG